jgi:hypothetical protein
MENETIFPGLLPSPKDDRDYMLSAVAPIPAHIPAEMPRTFDLPISNQGSNPSCVGHTCAAIRSYLAYKQGIEIQFDGEWIYQECKKIDGLPNVKGTFFRAGMWVLKNIGAMPLGGGNPGDWKIGAYAQVDDLSFEGLNRANFLFGAVLTAFTGSNPGWQQAHIRAPRSGETNWNHATAREGYGLDGNGIIQNSWGIKKGDNGIFYNPMVYRPFEAWIVSQDLLLNAPKVVTGWIAADVPNTIKDNTLIGRLNLRETANGKIIKTLPVDTKFNVIGTSGIIGGHVWDNVQII